MTVFKVETGRLKDECWGLWGYYEIFVEATGKLDALARAITIAQDSFDPEYIGHGEPEEYRVTPCDGEASKYHLNFVTFWPIYDDGGDY